MGTKHRVTIKKKKYSPEEISAHAGSSADADGVYLNFQMPDFLYGSTTGDAGDPDHKCRVYVGYAELTSSSGFQFKCVLALSILDNKLKDCVLFSIYLSFPPPVPETYSLIARKRY